MGTYNGVFFIRLAMAGASVAVALAHRRAYCPSLRTPRELPSFIAKDGRDISKIDMGFLRP